MLVCRQCPKPNTTPGRQAPVYEYMNTFQEEETEWVLFAGVEGDRPGDILFCPHHRSPVPKRGELLKTKNNNSNVFKRGQRCSTPSPLNCGGRDDMCIITGNMKSREV